SYLRFKPDTLFTVTNEAHNKWHKLDNILTPLQDAAENYPHLSAETRQSPQGWISVNRHETQAVNIYRAKTTRLTLRPKPSANNELSPAIMLFKRGTELILSD